MHLLQPIPGIGAWSDAEIKRTITLTQRNRPSL
jgi:hypothetical protein